MRRAQRLRKRESFAAVYRYGRPYRSQLFVLRSLRNDLPHSRFGFTVAARLGNAVVRNRTKRRLREAVRSLPVMAGWDVVLNARRGAPEANYQQLRSNLASLMERAGLMDSKGSS